jgi:hypothetical protein
MNRGLLQKIGRCGIAGLVMACFASSVFANAMDATLSAEVSSRYMWNAFDRLEVRGLESGPVFQPRLTLVMMGSPLMTHVGGSFRLEQDVEIHEAVYGVSVQRSVSPFTRFGLGYNYYDDTTDATPVSPGPQAAIAGDGHEIWASLSVSSPTGVKPNVGVRREDPKSDGADAYYVAHAGLAYSLPVVPAAGVGGVSFDLNWNTNVLYNTGVKVDDVEVVGRGVSAWTVGVAGSVQAANVVVSPYVNYQVSIEPSVLDENPFWAGIGVSYTF